MFFIFDFTMIFIACNKKAIIKKRSLCILCNIFITEIIQAESTEIFFKVLFCLFLAIAGCLIICCNFVFGFYNYKLFSEVHIFKIFEKFFDSRCQIPVWAFSNRLFQSPHDRVLEEKRTWVNDSWNNLFTPFRDCARYCLRQL